MIKKKGEAAFNSADDVLTDQIINQTGKHNGEQDTSDPTDTASDSFDEENQEPGDSDKPESKALLIAAIAGIVFLIIGIFMFRCRKCGRNR